MKNLLILIITLLTTSVFGQVAMENPSDFIPKGFVVFEKIYGDLNKDGIEDCVLIIKGTDKSKIISDEYRGKLDRNRRGIIILFKKNDYYELAVKNYDCFSSENEDGGVYFPPELSIEIRKGNMYIIYSHGRYGGWTYTFRYQNSDFELIGFDESSLRMAIFASGTSINFLTKKKQETWNKYIDDEEKREEEVLEEEWSSIKISRLLKLSEIKDFDELDMTVY